MSRRAFLGGSLGALALAAIPACAAPGTRPVIGFTPIPASSEDALRVAPEYDARVLLRWGDPIGAASGAPEFRMDASNSAAEQAVQAGMHHDGMQFFPLPYGSSSASHGLLALNHEYLDQALLFPDGTAAWSAEKVVKSQHAVGVSIVEVRMEGGNWRIVRPSQFARRLTARTPCRVSGPAAGHALMRTAADPEGVRILGTHSGCAHGWTPWGTYLSCEENWQFQFVQRGQPTRGQRRYRIPTRDFSYRWGEFDERFDLARHPNEPHRFGWVVEVDPYDPASVPVKRTALGRFMHEGAACAVAADLRLAFYLADDDAFEYIYKFVTARPYDASNRAANRDLLDSGTLYVARFAAGGRGDWLPLTASSISRDPGEILVHARLAADSLGATRMDRPEWIMPHPVTRELYCSLTNNVLRGEPGREGPNPANPRANNVFGHILRWREAGNDPASTRFEWEIFARGGENIGDALGSPDALWIDAMGTLWVGTDAPSSALENSQVFAVDPQTRVFRRFLTGPRGCEMTGFVTTPDNRTAFVNVQHPGEGASKSNWPDYALNGRPRSATVVIRRKDGGIIGT